MYNISHFKLQSSFKKEIISEIAKVGKYYFDLLSYVFRNENVISYDRYFKNDKNRNIGKLKNK